MKIDTAQLTARTDLRALLTAELGPADRAGAWCCPFHEDRRPSFGIVRGKPHLWHCFSCGQSGDAIGFLMKRHGLSFRDAAARLSGPGGLPPVTARTARPLPAPKVRQSETPPDAWALRAEQIATDAARLLWEPEGLPGLEYLRTRGFADSAILAAGLGWLAEDRREAPEAWGLDDAGKDVYLPAGILIAWRAAGQVFRLNVRRLAPGTGPKYIGPAGWKPGLYRPAPFEGLPVVLVEGELDALSILQAAPDLCRPAATGSATGGRTARDVYTLAAAPCLLLAFDADRAGDDAAKFWQGLIPAARRCRPPVQYKDAAAMPRPELRAWLAEALSQFAEPAPAAVTPFPPEWLRKYDADTLELLARLTVDGSMTDAEAEEKIHLSGF